MAFVDIKKRNKYLINLICEFVCELAVWLLIYLVEFGLVIPQTNRMYVDRKKIERKKKNGSVYRVAALKNPTVVALRHQLER